MRELLNFCLNKLIGARLRFSNIFEYGDDTKLLPHFSYISNGNKNKIKIGDKCILAVRIISEGEDAYFKFGDRVYIGKSDIICRTGIEFGNDIMVAWGVTFYDHDSHSLDFEIRKYDIIQQISDFNNYNGNFLKNKNWEVVKTKPIKVCDNVWIGMNAVVLKGVTIGEGAIVAACAVVTKDVPPYCVVAGNPAVVVKKVEK